MCSLFFGSLEVTPLIAGGQPNGFKMKMTSADGRTSALRALSVLACLELMGTKLLAPCYMQTKAVLNHSTSAPQATNIPTIAFPEAPTTRRRTTTQGDASCSSSMLPLPRGAFAKPRVAHKQTKARPCLSRRFALAFCLAFKEALASIKLKLK